VLIHSPGSISEEEAREAVQRFLLIALESIPGDEFFDAVLGISFNTNVVPDITSVIFDLFESGKTASVLAANLRNYDLFWRDMAVATCASMVLYSVAHLKDKLAGKDLSVWIGFAFASVFWIFAGYTFAETITFALELRVNSNYLNILYIVITTTAVLLEAFIHAYGGKCSPLRLIALLCLKIFFNLLRSAFVLYMCRVIITLFSIEVSSGPVNIPLNMFGMIVSAGIVLCTILLEAKVTKWSEKVLG